MRFLIDFLFPKSPVLRELEALSPGEVLKRFPPAPEIGRVVALFAYHDPAVREFIWEIKYRRNPVLIETAAVILLDVLKHELAERVLFESAGWQTPLLVPLPISEKRRRERGYNQTALLAEALQALDTDRLFTLDAQALVKSRHTSPQTLTESKKDRLRNLEGSMAVSDPSRVRGRHVILLDDVTTTGATFAEAKRALKQAGAKKILCLALAH